MAKAEVYLFKCKAVEEKAAEYAAICRDMHFKMVELYGEYMTQQHAQYGKNDDDDDDDARYGPRMTRTSTPMQDGERWKPVARWTKCKTDDEDDDDDTTGKYLIPRAKYMSRPSLFGAYFGPYDPEL